jgi:hypothetical protein
LNLEELLRRVQENQALLSQAAEGLAPQLAAAAEAMGQRLDEASKSIAATMAESSLTVRLPQLLNSSARALEVMTREREERLRLFAEGLAGSQAEWQASNRRLFEMFGARSAEVQRTLNAIQVPQLLASSLLRGGWPLGEPRPIPAGSRPASAAAAPALPAATGASSYQLLDAALQTATGVKLPDGSPGSGKKFAAQSSVWILIVLWQIISLYLAAQEKAANAREHRRIELMMLAHVADLTAEIAKIQDRIGGPGEGSMWAWARVTRAQTLRAAAASEAPAIGRVSVGERLRIVTNAGRWYYVERTHAGAQVRGWLYRRHLTIE